MKGIFCWRQNQGAIPTKDGRFRRFVGQKGLADIIGILHDGRFLAVEVKRPKKHPSLEQEQFLAEINARGGLALVVHSASELEEALANYEFDVMR